MSEKETTCQHCRRDRGFAFGQCAKCASGECLWIALRRTELELAEANAELHRLRAMCDDRDDKLTATQVALSEAGIPELELSTGEPLGGVDRIERLRRQRDEAGAEASALQLEMRAMYVFIESAAARHDSTLYAHRFTQVCQGEVLGVVLDHPENGSVVLPLFGSGKRPLRSAFDDMAKKAGPLPNAVLADSPNEEPIGSLRADVHEVALRIFVEMQVTSAYERAVAAAYEKARAFVDHREAVLRGEKSEWESDR